VEPQTPQKAAREENIVEAQEQLSIEVQVELQQATIVQEMAKAQRKVMEMERHESKIIMKRKRTILDSVTFLKKNIKIPNFE
jgi:hypothetical protein